MYVDGDRKIKISKMHTGEHILYKSLEKFIPDIEMVKVDLDEHESSIFIKCNELNWDVLFKSENLANQIIDEEREILTHIISKDELDEWTDKLRIKLERIKDDKIRIIEVKDFDYSACFGTHVNKSNEISNVFITKFNQVKGKWEIRFVVDTKEKLYDYASVSRISAELLETDMTSVNDEIKRLQNQIEDYKIRYREISKKLLDFNKHEKINDINLIYNIVEDIPKKQLIDKSSELLNDKTIVLFINLNEDRATVLLNISSDLKINAPKLLNKLLLKFDGKGGGRDNFAMGSISNQDLAKVIDEFKKLI